jgi:hypothetical protein
MRVFSHILPRFGDSDIIGTVQILKLLSVQFLPFSSEKALKCGSDNTLTKNMQ